MIVQPSAPPVVDNATLQLVSGTLSVKNSGIGSAQLATAVSNLLWTDILKSATITTTGDDGWGVAPTSTGNAVDGDDTTVTGTGTKGGNGVSGLYSDFYATLPTAIPFYGLVFRYKIGIWIDSGATGHIGVLPFVNGAKITTTELENSSANAEAVKTNEWWFDYAALSITDTYFVAPLTSIGFSFLTSSGMAVGKNTNVKIYSMELWGLGK